MDDDIATWWSAARSSAPDGLAGLWFGLVELVPAGWSMYVAGTRSFDAADGTAEWAVGPYAWQSAHPYVAMPEIGDLDVASALELAADLVRNLAPWRDVPVAGVAVGFDDGDVAIVRSAAPEEPLRQDSHG